MKSIENKLEYAKESFIRYMSLIGGFNNPKNAEILTAKWIDLSEALIKYHQSEDDLYLNQIESDLDSLIISPLFVVYEALCEHTQSKPEDISTMPVLLAKDFLIDNITKMLGEQT